MRVESKTDVLDSQHQLRRACAELHSGLRSKSARVEQFLSDYPAIAAEPDHAIELIFSEFVTRESLGEQPEPHEYYTRFPQFRERLERLFQVDDLLKVDDPPTAVDRLLADRDGVSEKIGVHEIREELGRGGVGVVYRAYHPVLKREVALKVLRAGALADERDRQRFRREAELAARLQHPNIVPVYEVGEHNGEPYLVMELLGGGSLRQQLANHPLPAADAARLLVTLARAVQHAHDRNVIHRDLKPGNVLIEDSSLGKSAIPKIADFGLATVFESDRSDHPSGLVVGTASYMAPEQAAGKRGWATPAVDVYALGAIFYECLTGRPPFLGDSDVDTLHQVMHEWPLPPRQLQPKTPCDLDTICLKCLHKDPSRRYGQAGELADDLQRFLDGQPIVARPAGWMERTWKWAKRRPTAAALITVSLVALATVVGLVSHYTSDLRTAWTEANSQKSRAEQNEKAALDALAAASEQRDQTRQAVDALSQLTDAAFGEQPRLAAKHEQVVAKVVEQYEKLANSDANDPAARQAAGQAHLRAGRLQKLLGRLDDADRSLTAAIASFEKSVDDSGLADALIARAILRSGRGRPVDGIADYDAARTAIDRLMKADPANATYPVRWAEIAIDTGTQRVRMNQFREAVAEIERIQGLLDQRLVQSPGDTAAQLQKAKCERLVGFAAQRQGRSKDAEHSFRRALEWLPAGGEWHSYRSTYQLELSGVLIEQRRGADAEPLIRAALVPIEQQAAAAPDVPDYRIEVARARSQLGLALLLQEKYADAEKEYLKVIPEHKNAIQLRPGRTETITTAAGSITNYGQLLIETKRFSEAVEKFDEAIALLKPIDGRRDSPPAAKQYLTLAMANRAKTMQALGNHVAAAETWEQVFGRDAKPSDQRRVDYALSLVRIGNAKKAAEILQPAGKTSIPLGTAFELARCHALIARNTAFAESATPLAIRALKACNQPGFFEKTGRFEDLNTNEDWSSLRQNPAFQEIINHREPPGDPNHF